MLVTGLDVSDSPDNDSLRAEGWTFWLQIDTGWFFQWEGKEAERRPGSSKNRKPIYYRERTLYNAKKSHKFIKWTNLEDSLFRSKRITFLRLNGIDNETQTHFPLTMTFTSHFLSFLQVISLSIKLKSSNLSYFSGFNPVSFHSCVNYEILLNRVLKETSRVWWLNLGWTPTSR
jgi:hypothetical protein